MGDSSYLEIRNYRDSRIGEVSRDHFRLNDFHDEIMRQVIELAVCRTKEKYGPLPCSFSFFVMGSAGRFEQSIWSDQDNGIIYQEVSPESQAYFLKLGMEITAGLYLAGYDYCDGGVMANNPIWCKSMFEWQQQLTNWLLDSSWESIRYLLIFIDGRSIYGENKYIEKLKTIVYQTVHKEQLISKVLGNTLYIKKGVNVLGNLLVETHGPYAGSLNLKEVGLFPYVNAVRLLAIKANVTGTSTLSRLGQMQEAGLSSIEKDLYKKRFLQLLNYRLLYGNHTDYKSGHYIPIQILSKEQNKELKTIIRNGAAFFRLVRRLIEKDD
ncbi:DUF294 nucleotidyltransferase-like domain-containing protein [Neobacillus sp. NRS-1170]|uniref:DUF294 nucleotidyltransferase-like domain-containing protein n=1 Tax=Neobacillus sp. NRS-1170 TaxID=3233898 RepID=UPI003D269191